jgi:molybdopterin synthase catalytic subunit
MSFAFRSGYGIPLPASKEGYSLENMRVHLLPFGVLKDYLAPAPLELPDEAKVADLLTAIADQLERYPAAGRLLPRIAVSVNAEYAQADWPLHEGDHVGLLPPVSGGVGQAAEAENGPILTYLTRDEIPSARLVEEVKRSSDGAVAIFEGIVRDNTRGRVTRYLDYEAYEEMASRQMVELAAQARDRFGVRAVTLVHRLGQLQIGETSVLIVVASAHRGAAFDACRWLIDTLKKTVPIWKKEIFTDGAVWADGEPFPEDLIAESRVTTNLAAREPAS